MKFDRLRALSHRCEKKGLLALVACSKALRHCPLAFAIEAVCQFCEITFTRGLIRRCRLQIVTASVLRCFHKAGTRRLGTANYSKDTKFTHGDLRLESVRLVDGKSDPLVPPGVG